LSYGRCIGKDSKAGVMNASMNAVKGSWRRVQQSRGGNRLLEFGDAQASWVSIKKARVIPHNITRSIRIPAAAA